MADTDLRSFWNAPTSDPKRKFRWFVTMTPERGGGETLWVAAKTIDKPSFEIENTQHQFINHQFNFPGRVKWNGINATFVDLASSTDGGLDVGSVFYSMLEGSGYEFPRGADACKVSITKEQAVSAFGPNFTINQVDADGQPVETWRLVNPWITTLEFGNLDYGDEGLVEINVSIVFDWAEKIK